MDDTKTLLRAANFNFAWFSEQLPSAELLERLLIHCNAAADSLFKKIREAAGPRVLAS